MRKLNSETKNGYAISKTEASDAPSILIAEKIKKFASTARTTEMKIKPRFHVPELASTRIDC